MIFDGNKYLAFGVELHELDYNSDKRTFAIKALKKALGLRGVPPNIRKPKFIGDPNEELGENIILIEKGEYRCRTCNNLIAPYRKFNK